MLDRVIAVSAPLLPLSGEQVCADQPGTACVSFAALAAWVSLARAAFR